MSIPAPDKMSMEDPLCDSSLGSMVTLDYVTPLKNGVVEDEDDQCMDVSSAEDGEDAEGSGVGRYEGMLMEQDIAFEEQRKRLKHLMA